MSELNNKENYKSEINDSLKDILHVYIRIVVDYLQFMIKKDNNPKKKQYFKFILLRGLETMTHIFNYILFCTKNLNIAESYAEKSMFYYVEFINQITDNQNIYLQFTSRDAVIYVYKKTIYEIKKPYIIEPNQKIINLCDEINLYTQKIKNIAADHADTMNKINIESTFRKSAQNLIK